MIAVMILQQQSNVMGGKQMQQTAVSFSLCQQNLTKTFENQANTLQAKKIA